MKNFFHTLLNTDKTRKEKATYFSLPQMVITDRGILDIDKLKKGYKIVADHGQVNTVLKVDKKLENGYFYVINKNLVLFENQSIFANGNVTHAKLLKRNDELVHKDGSVVKVATIKKVKGSYYFHRLEVSGDHTYYINNILVHNASRFWVGGTGNWDTSSTTHWSATSGGSNGASNPSTGDSCTINGSSGGGTITTTANIDVLSIDFTGFAGTFAGSNNIQCRGNFKFASGMTQSWTGQFTSNVNTCLLTSAGKSFGGQVNMSSSITLQDALVFPAANSLNLSVGTFDANNFNVTGGAVIVGTSPTVTMGSGTWTLSGDNAGAGGGSGVFYLNSSSATINANTSTIKFTNTGNGAIWMRPQGKTFNNIWFSRGASTGEIAIFADGMTFNDIKDDGTGTHNFFFEDGQTYTGTTFHISGTAGHLISVWARQSTSNFTLSIATGTISVDYLNLKRSTANGGATFYAGANSTNTSNNSGWIFTAPPSGPVNMKTLNSLEKASIKTVNGLAIGSVKTFNNLA